MTDMLLLLKYSFVHLAGCAISGGMTDMWLPPKDSSKDVNIER
jgi:hypothetical protein